MNKSQLAQIKRRQVKPPEVPVVAPPIDFDALTENQRHVLGCVAINEDGGHNRKTLDSLAARGLIVQRKQLLVGGRWSVLVNRYEVPLPVHIQWCQWCSRQPGMEEA